MLQTLLICFREGLEGFLVVAIATLFLRRTGHTRLIGAVRGGLVVSILGCAAVGVVLSRIGALSSVWTGGLTLLAAALIAACVLQLGKQSATLARSIGERLESAALADGNTAWWGVFAFIVLMVGREGLETATLLASLAVSTDTAWMAVGGAMGLALAGAMGLLWVRLGPRIQLGRFFRVTSWFMGVMCLQLLVYAFHEFTEAGVVPGIDNAWWHLATEDLAEGWIAQAIAFVLVLIPTLWMISLHLSGRRPAGEAA